MEQKEKECTVQLFEHLGAQRQNTLRSLIPRDKQYASGLDQRLKGTVKKLEVRLPSNGKRDPDGNAVSAEMTASALKLLADLAQAPRVWGRRICIHIV